MLKSKFKIVVLLAVIILSLSLPIVRAEDNEAEGYTTTQEEIIQGAENQAAQNATSMENYKQGDVYLTGDDVTIDYIIDGNLFVFANTVNIYSQIGGDAFIYANNINIQPGSYIFGNLFAVSPNITVGGSIYDLYAYSNNIQISGYIARDVRAISKDFTLSGMIGRNVFLRTNNIQVNTSEEDTIATKASISGDLNYSATQEISIPDGVVAGNVNFTKVENSSISIQSYILSLGKFLVTVVIVWLLCLWLAPKFLDRTNRILTKKLPSTIGLGILTPILLIIAFVILILLGITSTIAGLSLLMLLLACIISSSIFVIAINNLICKKLKVEKTVGKLGILILTAIVLWLVCLIPFVGRIISIVVAILGIGILINGVLPFTRNKEISSDTKKTNEPKSEKTKKDKNKKKEDK